MLRTSLLLLGQGWCVAFAAVCIAALVTVGTASADTLNHTPNDKADDADVECVNEWSSFRLKTIGDVAPQHENVDGRKVTPEFFAATELTAAADSLLPTW